ncbi:caprin-1-like [Mercenaria mercenaria]|uniref:caprin-1-like n=1 Tax=Mercenaria mercenaria TaxID=6596 RepID=UPI00234E83B4|nr:caprin-1-like [Mercenaria mercenaria]
MPSASTKVEIPASSEALDPFKRVLTVVDKKVRNLEKRKLKLDTLKQKKDSGADLEKDQQVAVDRYGEVIQNLEFARDLQKQFQAISADVEKLLKKQAKRGKSEKQLQEVKRVKEVLQLQGLLDNLGSEKVRQDFQTGKHGAIVLTEENLDQLDELYKMISPTRDGETDYLESLSEASEHIVCLLDAKDKPVVGTTSYKELKELLDLISQCGYFEKAQATEEGVKEGGDAEFEVVEHTDVPAPDSEEVQSSLPPEVPAEDTETEPVATGQQIMNNDTLNTQPQVITAQADVFFNTPVSSQTVEQQQAELAALSQQQRRPFQEIVSSVQGNFNFLQESTIEVEAKREFSPHMDPAVVAAHPMPQSQQPLGRPPSNQTPDSSSLPQTGFSSASTFAEQQSAFGDQQSLDSELSVSKVTHGGSVDKSVYSQANVAPSQDFSGSAFTQSNLSHSLQTDSLFSGTVSAGDSNTGNRGMMGKGETTSHTQYEIPPQLPMPPGHEQSAQDNQQQSDPEKKDFPMNPNATEFQSLIYNQSGEEAESGNKSSNDGFQGGTYSNSGYSQGPREQRGGRGGFRGGRGGNRGGNMSNGYSRGGRGNYQGYPPRDNYRPDGFQGGYSGSNYNNGGFQKRGDSGRGGSSRGGNRGGGQRGGFNRGGGGGGRGSARGTGQGFGRPNFNQQQQ